MGENLPYGYVEPTEPSTEAPISPEEGIWDEGFDIAVDTALKTVRFDVKPEKVFIFQAQTQERLR